MTKAKIQLRIENANVKRVDASDIELSTQNGTDISLKLDGAEIKDLRRQGRDLIVELNNGEVLV